MGVLLSVSWIKGLWEIPRLHKLFSYVWSAVHYREWVPVLEVMMGEAIVQAGVPGQVVVL